VVIIDHRLENGLYHVRYCHLRENMVYKGQKVLEGDQLGFYADVGFSFGAHIHIDMFDVNWAIVNIEELFKKEGLI
jgi:murein DD-endopeptidase MepM/ murein hydrolase activator NlpD